MHLKPCDVVVLVGAPSCLVVDAVINDIQCYIVLTLTPSHLLQECLHSKAPCVYLAEACTLML